MQCKTNQQKQNGMHANKIKVQVIGFMTKCMKLFLGMPKPPTLGRSLIIHPQGVMDFHFLVPIPFPPMNNPNTFQLVQPMDYITQIIMEKRFSISILGGVISLLGASDLSIRQWGQM